MKAFRIIVSLLATSALIYSLNRSWGPVPPLGKFLDPFHGFWQNAGRDDTPRASLDLAGLKEEVTVYFDSMLIPHIFAQSDADLYLAQGFVTAQHRLWQMEVQTHAGAGRLSEILGPSMLNADRLQRRLGMVAGAQKTVETMENDPIARVMVSRYTEGVNAYINMLDYEDLPFEYKLLDYSPEPWTNLKAGILLMYMSKTLSTGEQDLEMTNMLRLFGKESLDLLFPDREDTTDPVVDNAGGWKFPPIRLDSFPLAVPDLIRPASALKQPSVAPDLFSTQNKSEEYAVGSNNWAVSGTRTATGSPILCNDPHLTMSLPSLWYAVHLNAPGVNTMGASLPAAPGVIIGFNDSISWGITNAQRDLVDFYQIQFKDSLLNEYRLDGEWKNVVKVIETFKIKNAPSFTDTIRFTIHGPVTYEKFFHPEYEKNNCAYRWIAHDTSEEIMTLYKLNRARNHADYMEALNQFSSPAQNFVFASVSGDIAMRVQGRYPVRRPGEGRFILDGSNSKYNWQAFIPNDQNITYKNPIRGFVSSANQYPVDTSYPYYVHGSGYEAYRNRRINDVLSRNEKATVEDLMNLQFEMYNLKAAESLPFLLAQLDSASLTEPQQKAYRILKGWNFVNDPDAEGATYYQAWWDALRPLIWDELVVENVSLDFPTSFTTIKLMKEQPDLSFFDLKSTSEKETAKEIAQKAFLIGVDDVEKWKENKGLAPRWGTFKDTYVAHLLRQESLGVHVDHGGNASTVNATTRTHGPSWRMVVSLEKSGVKAWGVYPGGQSGNPGSKYYSNMIPLWGKGKYFSLPFYPPGTLASKTLATTRLKPASK